MSGCSRDAAVKATEDEDSQLGVTLAKTKIEVEASEVS